MEQDGKLKRMTMKFPFKTVDSLLWQLREKCDAVMKLGVIGMNSSSSKALNSIHSPFNKIFKHLSFE
jgi:hypothetical protein